MNIVNLKIKIYVNLVVDFLLVCSCLVFTFILGWLIWSAIQHTSEEVRVIHCTFCSTRQSFVNNYFLDFPVNPLNTGIEQAINRIN